jgi:hypothetical protein
MVWFEIAFHNLAVFLGGQGVEDLTKPRTNVPIQPVPPHLWDEDDMIFAVPLAVRQAVVNQ